MSDITKREVCKWTITPDIAFERNIAAMENYKNDSWKVKPEVVDAIRVLRQESWGIHQILNIWPRSELFEFLDSDPKDYFMDVLDKIPRYWFEGCIPTYWNDAHKKEEDFIIVYDFLIDTGSYDVPTGWAYIWFSVFDHTEAEHEDGTKYFQHNKLAFAGRLIVGADIFDANSDEIRQWKYANDFEWTQMTYDELIEDMKKYGRTDR